MLFFFLYFAENLNSISERNNKQSDKKEGGKRTIIHIKK